MTHLHINTPAKHPASNWVAESCGWYGATALIAAYFLVSFGVVDGQHLAYLLLNLSGGIGLLIAGAVRGFKQSVILNAFWAIIGIIAIIRLLF